MLTTHSSGKAARRLRDVVWFPGNSTVSDFRQVQMSNWVYDFQCELHRDRGCWSPRWSSDDRTDSDRSKGYGAWSAA